METKRRATNLFGDISLMGNGDLYMEDEEKKNCHKCIHVPMCKLYNVLRNDDFSKFWENRDIWTIAKICYYYVKEVKK